MERMSLIRTLASGVKGLESNTTHRRVERRDPGEHGDKAPEERHQGLQDTESGESGHHHALDYTFQLQNDKHTPVQIYNASGRLVSLHQAV